jgi:hypothetical protein
LAGDPQPLMTVTETAVATAASPNDLAAIRPTRGPLISTSPTVTSGPLAAAQPASSTNYDRL